VPIREDERVHRYVLVCASGLDGWREMDSFQAAIASSYSSALVLSVNLPRKKEAQTEMVVRYAKVEERAGIFLDFRTSFVKLFRCLNVSFFELSGALL
jgi:hypothetical protein